MKKILILCFLMTGLQSFSQTKEKFDIATYTVPKDWKKEVKTDVVTFTYVNQAAGSYLVMAVYKSIAGSGAIANDYNNEWNELVAKRYTVTGKQETEGGRNDMGWNFKTGAAPVRLTDGSGIVVLTVFEKEGTVLSLLSLMNKADNIPAMESFINSVGLEKAGAGKKEQATAWSSMVKGGQCRWKKSRRNPSRTMP